MGDKELMMYKESYYNIEICMDSLGRTLLFNSRSESIAWFDENIIETFREKRKIAKQSLLPQIIDLGFVVEEDYDEIYDFLHTRRIVAFNKNPERLSLVIAPTMKCNYNCEYCFEDNKSLSVCSDDVRDSIIMFVKQQAEGQPSINHIHIQWFGGEPLLAINVIEYISNEIIAFCDKHSICYDASLITNGFLLDCQMADRLRNLHISYIQITLDGFSQTYSKIKLCDPRCFGTVIENIANCCDFLPVTIRLNISKRNTEEIKDLIYFLMEKRKLNVKINLAMVHAYTKEMDCFVLSVDEFESVRNDIYDWAYNNHYLNRMSIRRPHSYAAVCDAMLENSFAIDPQGFLYKCTHQLGCISKNVGHVLSGPMHNKMSYEFANNDLPQHCRFCKVLPVCGGGCILNRLEKGIEVDCENKIAAIKDAVKYYEKSMSGKQSERINVAHN